jgi:hypothetical protein
LRILGKIPEVKVQIKMVKQLLGLIHMQIKIDPPRFNPVAISTTQTTTLHRFKLMSHVHGCFTNMQLAKLSWCKNKSFEEEAD